MCLILNIYTQTHIQMHPKTNTQINTQTNMYKNTYTHNDISAFIVICLIINKLYIYTYMFGNMYYM